MEARARYPWPLTDAVRVAREREIRTVRGGSRAGRESTVWAMALGASAPGYAARRRCEGLISAAPGDDKPFPVETVVQHNRWPCGEPILGPKYHHWIVVLLLVFAANVPAMALGDV